MIAARLRLRSKLLVAFAIVLLPVLVLLWAGFRVSLAQQEQRVLGDQELSAQAIAVQVDETFDSLVAFGWAVASDPLVQTMEPSRLSRRLRDLRERSEQSALIAVFDAEGRPRGWGAEGGHGEPPPGVAADPDFQRAMATDLPHVSDVVTLPVLDATGVLVVVPLRGGEGQAVGVVMVGVATDQFVDRYEHARLSPGQAILLADRTGRLAFHTARRYMTPPESARFVGTEPPRGAVAGTRTTLETFASPVTGDERLAAFVPTLKYRWVVGVTIPRAVALGPLRRTFQLEMATFTGILVLSVLLALLLARYLVHPVHTLEATAASLGRGNLAARVRVQSGDEIGRLGEAFNAMGDQLGRLYREQSELLQLRQDFMQAAAHELKTPIATILSSLHLLCGKETRPEPRRLLDIIGKQVRRMTLLADDLLTVTRLKGPAAELERRRFDLDPVLREAVRRARESTDRPQTISLAASPALVVEADQKLVELVILRLLENATAASPDGGYVEISSAREGRDAVISVQDRGSGIPAERQAYIFEPFYEPVPSGSPGYRGAVSLRLHVCKRILDVHGGRIWFSSGPEGSTFSFSLPLAEEERPG